MRVDGASGGSCGLNVGVVGCGYWGSKHVRVLQTLPGVRGVTAIDRDGDLLASLQQQHPNISTCSSFEQGLDVVDAVVIATPPLTHAALAQHALERGRHVLCEKPLATSVAEAETLVELADRAGLTLMSGHTFEHNPAVWKLRELVQSGELGRIYHIDTARLNLGLYQGDVNVIWDLAPHDVSILNFILGAEPDRVMAWAPPHEHHELADVAYLKLDYDELQLSTQVHVSWLDPCKVRRVTVTASKKMVVYNDLAVDERVRVFDKGVAFDNGGEGTGSVSYRNGGIESPYIEFEEPLLIEDRHFVHSSLTGAPPPSDGRSGLAVVRVLAAAEVSLRTGGAVEIEPAAASARPVPAMATR